MVAFGLQVGPLERKFRRPKRERQNFWRRFKPKGLPFTIFRMGPLYTIASRIMGLGRIQRSSFRRHISTGTLGKSVSMLLACNYKPLAIIVYLRMVKYEQRTSISSGNGVCRGRYFSLSLSVSCGLMSTNLPIQRA